MKRLARNLATLVAALSVALVVCELALQLADFPPATFSPWVRDPDTAYRYASSLHTRMQRTGEFDVAFETNRAGFRDDEIRPKRGPRILLLGDSFASGYGVERGEMFADLLEKRLGTEVVNAAVGGYEIVHQVRFFDARGKLLEPDWVLYAMYVGNDLSRNDEWTVDDNGHLVSPTRSFPLRRKHEIKLIALVRQAIYRRAERERDEWRPFADYLALAARNPSPEAASDLRDAERWLSELRAAVRATGAGFTVALIPYRTIVDPDARARFAASVPNFEELYDLDLPVQRALEMCRRLGIDTIDLTPVLRAHYERGGEPLYYPVDGHLNSAGHRLVAQALSDALRARLAR